MILGMYCIQDVKTTFMTPVVDVNDEAAIRGFKIAVQRDNGIMGIKPEDFRFYRIGSYDNESGVITPEVPIKWLADGQDAKGE